MADQEEIVDKSSNRIKCTVNPLLTPPPPPSLWLIYFKQVSGRGVIETGHVLEREGLFNLVKMVVSGPLRTVCHFFKSLRSVRIVTWIIRTVTVRVYWTTLGHHALSLTFREDRVALIFLCSDSRASKTRDHARGR